MRRRTQRATLANSSRGYTRIYFLVEGESRPWRCEHKGSWFQIQRDSGRETEVVCTYGQKHRVLSGFFLEPPPVEPEQQEQEWTGPPARRAVQLCFDFMRPLSWRDVDWSFLSRGNPALRL